MNQKHIEQHRLALEQWVQNESSVFMGEFLEARGLSNDHLKEMVKISPQFADSLEEALDTLRTRLVQWVEEHP